MALTSDFVQLAHATRPVESVQDYSRYRIVPARHPERFAGTIMAAIIIIAVLYSTFTNPRWVWDVFAQWFFAEPVLVGLGRTLLLTVLAAISGSILGTALALARVSKSPLLAGLSWGYIWLLRSIPMIVLLLILNNLGYLYETITIGIPFTETVFVNYPTVQLLTPFAAAFLGLTLNQSAFSQRSSVAVSSLSIMGSTRPQRLSVFPAIDRPSASCCHKPCVRSCPPASTS